MSDDEKPIDDTSDDREPIGEGASDGAAPVEGSGAGDYKVGYGRPPQHGKIKKGEVRNPRGKRRGKRSFKAEMAEVLEMRVPMTKGGKTVQISTRRASILKLADKAIKGDLRAIERIHEYALQIEEDEGNRTTTATLFAEDEQVLTNARERERERFWAEMHAQPRLPATAAATTPEETDQ